MGNASKVVFLSAASLIVGVYGISLKNVQQIDVTTALSSSTRVQNERTEDAAVRATLDIVAALPPFASGASGDVLALGGGGAKFHYIYTKVSPGNGKATLTMNQSGDTKTIDITLKKQTSTNPGFRRFTRGQWQITQYHARSLF